MAYSLEQVADYYDKTLSFYQRFWHRDESYALHYGFWDKNTRNLTEALLNENRNLAELTKITPGSKILDAGCGIGGSAIWLAQNYNVTVEGITISESQLKKANQLARQYDLTDRISFRLKDFLRTNYRKNTFDIVWAIESVCHAEDKRDFLKETYRILKPGGKLIVADGNLKRDLKPKEEKDYHKFLLGLALPNIAKMSDFRLWMTEAGFKNIREIDKTSDVRRSSRRIYWLTLLTYPLAKLFYKVGIIPAVPFNNSRAGIAQYKLVKRGAAGYGVFYGEK